MPQCERYITLPQCIATLYHTIQPSRVLIGFLRQFQVCHLPLQVSNCESRLRFVQWPSCFAIQLHRALITANRLLNQVVLALHICQQRPTISRAFNIAYLSKQFFRLYKSVCRHLKLALSIRFDTLKHVDLFSSLNKKELQALAKSCQERKYSAGSTLFSQGDTGVGLYVLTGGTVRITQAINPDKAEDVLGTEGPGGVLGEMALLDDLPRSATV